MTSEFEYSFFDTLSPEVFTYVRCGVCRDKSIDRYGTRRADIVGYIEWTDFEDEPPQEPEFLPSFKYHEAVPDQLRLMPNAKKAQYVYSGIVARCRNGHELRVSPERLDKLRLSGDGDLYLPGN